MKTKIIVGLSLVAALFLSASCGKENIKDDAVVAILKNGNTDYYKQIISSIEEESRAKGCKALIYAASNEYDINSQIQAAESLASLNYNVKGIIFNPIYDSTNRNDAENAICSFAGKNIPVIFLDTKPSELSPMKNSYSTYVGVDLQLIGTDFAEMVTETEQSKILSVYYCTAATMSRYETFKRVKGITDDNNSISITADDTLTAASLNAKLSNLGTGGSVVLFNGDFYDKILSFGEDVQDLNDKQIYAFDAYKSLLLNIKNGGNVKKVLAQNAFVMGKAAVDCIFSMPVDKNVFVTPIIISAATFDSQEVKPFRDFFGL